MRCAWRALARGVVALASSPAPTRRRARCATMRATPPVRDGGGGDGDDDATATAYSRTMKWLDEFIIAKDVCPFARAPREALDPHGLDVHVIPDAALESVVESVVARALELQRTVADGRFHRRGGKTTLVVAPQCVDLASFDAFLDVIHVCEGVFADVGLEGDVQVVGFHPEFAFFGEDATDAAAFTNRSPYAMFHLLRECDVARASGERDVGELLDRNASMLREIGSARLAEDLARLRRGDFDA